MQKFSNTAVLEFESRQDEEDESNPTLMSTIQRTTCGQTIPFDVLRIIMQYAAQTYLLSGSDDRSIKIWEIPGHAGSCRHVGTFKSTSDVLAITVLPDDGRLVAGCYDGVLRFWNANMMQAEVECEIPAHAAQIFALCVVRDRNNSRLVSASGDSTMKIWSTVAPYRCSLSINKANGGHSLAVYAMALLPHARLATGGRDYDIKIWDFRSQPPSLIVTLTGHTDDIQSLACIPHRNWLVSSSGQRDRSVRIWDIGRYVELRKLPSFGWPVEYLCAVPWQLVLEKVTDRSLAFQAAAQHAFVAMGVRNGDTLVFDLANKDLLQQRPVLELRAHYEPVEHMLLLPNEMLVSCVGRVLYVYDMTDHTRRFATRSCNAWKLPDAEAKAKSPAGTKALELETNMTALCPTYELALGRTVRCVTTWQTTAMVQCKTDGMTFSAQPAILSDSQWNLRKNQLNYAQSTLFWY